MEHPEIISLHRLKVYLVAKQAAGWFTNDEASKAAGISGRTARAHTNALVEKRVLEQATVFPGHRFRLLAKPNGSYVKALEEAAQAFGDAASL